MTFLIKKKEAPCLRVLPNHVLFGLLSLPLYYSRLPSLHFLSWKVVATISFFVESYHCLSQGLLKIWIADWRAFFLSLKPVGMPKNGTNITWTSLKDVSFCKVTRVLFKNWACHAHFNFEIWMAVAGSIFKPQTYNFGKLCIFSRCLNDINIIFW